MTFIKKLNKKWQIAFLIKAHYSTTGNLRNKNYIILTLISSSTWVADDANLYNSLPKSFAHLSTLNEENK